MSDLDNELLALAGGDISKVPSNSVPLPSTSHNASKRSRKSGTSGGKSKRRKALDMDSESDMEMSSGSEAVMPMDDESQEDEQPNSKALANPYPFEGIYIDLEDKQRIQSMSELDREAILGDRQDELQKIRDRENIKNMVRARDEESGKRYSAREKSRTGTTLAKAQKLDELKEKRQAKDRRPKSNTEEAIDLRRKRAEEGGWDDRSEDGEIDVIEEQALAREERAARKLEENATWEDISSVLLTRRRAAELCCTKFFDDYVKGMWVRVSVGFSKDDPKREMKYRVGEVRSVAQHRKYYEVEGQATKVALVVVLAKDEKTILLDIVSNSQIQENEWTFVVGECRKHNVRLPTKKEIARKVKFIDKYQDWVKDESDITAQVKARKEMRAQKEGPSILTAQDRLRLESERDQAGALGNMELHAQLTRQLEQATGFAPKTDTLMSELNERNRRANREEIRRAELAASEMRRQQMKALEAGATVKVDPSARVTINPRLHYEARPSTPSHSTNPPNVSGKVASVSATNNISNKGKFDPITRFEEMIAAHVHVDIDINDF
ncbi:hypothetical protein O181_027035 [Austropuccinia psidii MF-1]|uniref:Plus3 domain-containing protein n=1 Tax=Austropuccinia psidii MF-1 TaxID=1389203 RepID=A0A9Q3CQD2_9BASI|nr:hypothetical protein [Austropuccinia psidii MF-1]